MTAMPHLSLMQWDFKDQLSATSRQVVNDGMAETTYYVYDGAGQRVRKVTERQNGTRKNERIYLGGFEVYREYDGSGHSVTLERETLHVMDDKQRIALVETRTQGNDGSAAQLMRYQFGNHLGSASLELDSSAEVISYEEYFPYGSTSYQAVDQSIKAAAKRYRYTGMERDDESGLNHHTSRYYALWLGRWVSCDPIGVQDGLNLYQYCRASPVNRIDRLGSDSWSWNPLNFFSDDYTFNPGEYTAKVVRGFVVAAGRTAKDTVTRVADLSTQATASLVKVATFGHVELPYTEWSPESQRYDENLSIRENIRKTGLETEKGIKALGRQLSDKDPDAVGTLAFVVATSVGGKPPSLPSIPFFSVPQLATSVATTGARAAGLVLESAGIGTSALAKFGGPILATALTGQTPENSDAGKRKDFDYKENRTKSAKEQHRADFPQKLAEFLKDPLKEIKQVHPSPHDHHLLPRQFRSLFEIAGIDIEKFRTWLNPKTHLKDVHGGAAGGGLWNLAWKEFFQKNAAFTPAEVLKKLADLRASFGI